jgi:uncharacterized protein
MIAMDSRRAPKGCPICGKSPVEQFRPFCSRRCKDIDLHRWLSGVYAVPGTEEEEPPRDADDTDAGDA